MAYSSAGGDRYGRGYAGDARGDRPSVGARDDAGTFDPRYDDPRYDDRPTSAIPSIRERRAQAAATAAEAERRGLMYRLARERMSNRPGTDVALLVLRLASLLLLAHGIPKMMALPGFIESLHQVTLARQFPTVAGYLVVAGEVVLPVLLACGVLTRVAGALLAVQMALTYLLVHVGHDPLLAPAGGVNHEAALLFAVLGLALALSGAGRISLDRGMATEWRERKAERMADQMSEE